MSLAYLCLCRKEPSLAGQLYGSQCMARLVQRHTAEVLEAIAYKYFPKDDKR